MIKAVIIDDEIDARNALQILLKEFCTETIELIGEAGNIKEGIKLLEVRQPDLLFLDINMPDGNGFELLDSIPNKKFETIFITAYNDFALKAFRYSATDYLLKPIDPDELNEAIKKASDHSSNKAESNKNSADTLFKPNPKNTDNRTVAISDTKGTSFVNFEDIVSCRSIDNYAVVCLKDQSQLVATKALKAFEEMFEGLPFFRIHNSTLINLKHVTRYIRGEGGFVAMADKTELEVSRRKKKELLEKLKALQIV
jgi:two-component system, LytTR family, response regulator